MKKVFCILAGTCLLSFSDRPYDDSYNGIWMGAYESDENLENVVLKIDAQYQAELYKGTVEDENRLVGTYTIQGDSLLVFSCTSPKGEQLKIEGHFNKRKNYVDGVWQTNEKQTGNFYLRKQKFREMMVQP